MPVNILLVDDHAIVIDGLKLILESQERFEIVGTAEDGLQAVSLARDLKPDIIIMDIAMPNMNGIEATWEIKSVFPETEIVILSMKFNQEDIFGALKAGATGYVLKESAGVELVEAVSCAMNGRRFLSRKIEDMIIDSYLQDHEQAPEESSLELLSHREREVLQMVAEGKSNQEIAGMLHLSKKTVETYRSRIMDKLSLNNSSELIKFAIRKGLVSI